MANNIDRKDANSEGSKRTRKRASINGVRNILTVKGKEPGYHYRIVNDVGNRIEDMKALGYELVTDDVAVGDKRVDAGTGPAAHKEIFVGGGIKAKLMRIPEAWYNEDQQAKEANLRELDEAMGKGRTSGADYGSVELNVGSRK
jgi:hypothetical protein